MTASINPLDQVIQETVHHTGGVELLGDPKESLVSKAATVCELFEVSEEGLALLDPDATVEQQIGIWRNANLVADARRLLSHALPARYSLWWALLAMTEAQRQKPFPAKVVNAILAVRDFVLKPTDKNRRLCEKLADQADLTSGGGVLGYAAFLAGGSMAPPDCPPVVPQSHLCGRLCGVAVYLASVHFNPAKYKDHLQHFLDIGLQVAHGKLPWPEETTEFNTTGMDKTVSEPKVVEKIVETIAVERNR